MIHIRDIDHIVLRVRVPAPMLHFYCEVLGCHVERRDDEIGLIQLRAGRSLIDLVAVDSPLGREGGPAPVGTAHNLDHVCFRVDPFDESTLRAHLRQHAVEAGPLESRYGAQGYGPSLYVSDPEGNRVELKGPPSAAPE
jgi:catechol 2,3-dioxygenase-like lactoylglutathione lyase family enzyme